MTRPPILFIAPTRIGDAVLATSLLEHIRRTEPEARVTIVTSPLAAALFEGYPLLERIIPITKQTYNRHWLQVWRATIGTRWSEVWDIRGSIISYLVRVKHRHFYVKPKLAEPKVKQFETVFGISHLPYPVLWPRASDVTAAQAILPDGQKYLILAPIANWAPKEWPMANFIAAAHSLLSGTCAGYRPVIICAAHEREKALPLLNALAAHTPIDLTTGEHHLLTIFAAMQRAHGFIGNDSGLMHMASAARIPTLGLFGPTPHEVYQPWGERASFLCAPGGDLNLLTPHLVVDTFTARLHA